MYSSTLTCRDKDGYYWLTGRVDDVINVRYATEFQICVFSVFNLATFGEAIHFRFWRPVIFGKAIHFRS